MVYKLVEDENGLYQSQDGTIYDILEATNVLTPQGKNVGWTEYKNLNQAIESFNLTYIGPVEEPEEEVVEEDMISIILSEEVNK